jgi:CheY-like chemotaxis protein
MASKILIVDDDLDIRQLLGVRLKAAGYETERPDLILLDLMMPAGDGYVVMERLQAMPALEGVPIIIVSALDPQGEQERFAESRADAFFRKPFEHEELLKAIERALGGQPAP